MTWLTNCLVLIAQIRKKKIKNKTATRYKFENMALSSPLPPPYKNNRRTQTRMRSFK